jgi:peroxiredoxin
MSIAVSETFPNVTVTLVTADGPKPIETKDYFAGKTVVLFGLPGAFTPTCHKNHLPGFLANEDKFKGKGVDAIAMTSVNDPFVLSAWAERRARRAISISSPTAARCSPRRLASISISRHAAWACARSVTRCW